MTTPTPWEPRIRTTATITYAIAAYAAYLRDADPALVALFWIFGGLLLCWHITAWEDEARKAEASKKIRDEILR